MSAGVKEEVTIMYIVDTESIRTAVKDSGYKQCYLARQLNISDKSLSLLLSGKSRLCVGDYATLCNILGVPFNTFLKEV